MVRDDCIWFWAHRARLTSCLRIPNQNLSSWFWIRFSLNVRLSTHPLSCLLLRIKICDLFNSVSYDNRRQMAPLGLDIITSKPTTKPKSWTTSPLSLQTNNGSAEIECVMAEPHMTSTLALSGNKTFSFFSKRPDWLDSCQITFGCMRPWSHMEAIGAENSSHMA